MTARPPEQEAGRDSMRSRYEQHGVLGPLVRAYRAELPEVRAGLERCYAAADKAALARLAHRLCGEAATYGFDPIAEAARHLERTAKAAAPAPLDLQQAYEHLFELMTAAF